MAPALEIRLLGDFTLMQDGHLVVDLDSPRLQALLAYLLLRREAPQLRQQIAFHFWLDSNEAQARANLRNLLHRLRQAWPAADSYLSIETQSLHWHPTTEVFLDVAQFEVQLQRGREASEATMRLEHLQQAISVYRGELLPTCYDDWIQPDRLRLRQAFLQALELAAEIQVQQGNTHGAIENYQQLIRTEPVQEAAYRRLMDLHVGNGDRAAALRVYYRCSSILQRELGIEPDAATQAAYRHLVAPTGSANALPAPSTPVEATLIGRNLEWEQLLLTWHQVATGKRPPCVALIRGEAGLGKTRLATELVDWVERQGLTTATAVCYAPESDLPLVPVVSWLRGLPLQKVDPIWCAEMARLLPEMSGAAPDVACPLPADYARTEPAVQGVPWQKRRFYEALAQAIMTQRQPLLLSLEDIHWSDAETLAWLHYLLRLDNGAKLMVVATLRPEEAKPEGAAAALLTALQGQGRLSEIDLQPLDANATAALAETVLGKPLKQELAAALYRQTEGNPLFVVETLRNGLDDLEDTGSITHVSPRIQALLRARLARLSPTAHRLMEVAAVIGRSFSSEILLRAAKADAAEMVTALDELWRRHIVSDRDSDAYDFSHDKLRQTVYEAISPARRRWLHGRVAQALEASAPKQAEALAGRLAFHYEAAGQAQRAFQQHQEAAISAQRHYAYQAAALHLQGAIALIDRVTSEPESITRLYEALADVQTLLGRHQAAREALNSALIDIDPADSLTQGALTLKLARTWLAQYQLADATAAFKRVLAQLNLSPDAATSLGYWETWLDAQLGRLDVLYFSADLDGMAALVEEIQELLERHGSVHQRAEYQLIRLQLESRHRRFRLTNTAVETGMQAVALAERSGQPGLLQRSRFGLGFVLLWCGEIEAAIQELTEVADLCQTAGNVPLLDRCMAYLSVAQRLMGQVDAVRELLPQCRTIAENEANPLYLGVADANQAWLAYCAGDIDQAAEDAHRALTRWRELTFPFHWLACWPYLAVALETGDLGTTADQAKAMLAPEQQQLPDAVETALQRAVNKPTRANFRQALTLARRHKLV